MNVCCVCKAPLPRSRGLLKICPNCGADLRECEHPHEFTSSMPEWEIEDEEEF